MTPEIRRLIDQWRTADADDAKARGYWEAWNTYQVCANELDALLAAEPPPTEEGKLVWGTNPEQVEMGPGWQVAEPRGAAFELRRIQQLARCFRLEDALERSGEPSETARALRAFELAATLRRQLVLAEKELAALRSAPASPPPTEEGQGFSACLDCGLPYADFPLDVVLPRAQWLTIHPDEHRLLCAACIVKRASQVPGCTVVHAILEVAPCSLEQETAKPESADSARQRACAHEFTLVAWDDHEQVGRHCWKCGVLRGNQCLHD